MTTRFRSDRWSPNTSVTWALLDVASLRHFDGASVRIVPTVTDMVTLWAPRALAKQTSTPLAQLDGVAVRAEVEQMKPVNSYCCLRIAVLWKLLQSRAIGAAAAQVLCHAQGREFKSHRPPWNLTRRPRVSRFFLGVQ